MQFLFPTSVPPIWLTINQGYPHASSRIHAECTTKLTTMSLDSSLSISGIPSP